MKQTIQHPDELLETLQERRTSVASATGGGTSRQYREGYVQALDWAMRVVESFIFARPE